MIGDRTGYDRKDTKKQAIELPFEMNEAPRNRRRSRLRQLLAAGLRAFSRGWDLYLFIIGYGTIFGFLGLAALWLPGLPAGQADAGLPIPPGGEPGAAHWFGLNHRGDDMMAPILRSSGITVWLALLATVGGTAAGVLMGSAFSYFWRGRSDRPSAGATQWTSALPAMLPALALAAGWGTDFGSLVVIFGALCAIPVAGRASAWYREMERRGDVLAARAMGWSRARLFADEWLTRIWLRAGATAAMLLPGVLLAVATLDFALETASGRLGHLIADGGRHLVDAPWLLLFPGLFLAILTILLAALGWAVRRTTQEPLQERLW